MLPVTLHSDGESAGVPHPVPVRLFREGVIVEKEESCYHRRRHQQEAGGGNYRAVPPVHRRRGGKEAGIFRPKAELDRLLKALPSEPGSDRTAPPGTQRDRNRLSPVLLRIVAIEVGRESAAGPILRRPLLLVNPLP